MMTRQLVYCCIKIHALDINFNKFPNLIFINVQATLSTFKFKFHLMIFHMKYDIHSNSVWNWSLASHFQAFLCNELLNISNSVDFIFQHHLYSFFSITYIHFWTSLTFISKHPFIILLMLNSIISRKTRLKVVETPEFDWNKWMLWH